MNRYNIYGHEGMPENIIGIFSPGHRPVAYSFRSAWPADPHAPKSLDKQLDYLFGPDSYMPAFQMYGFNCSGELRPDHFYPERSEKWPIDPHAPRMRPIADDLNKWHEACKKAAKEPWNPLLYGTFVDSAIMDPTASAFALEALASKIGIRSAVNAMNDAIKDHLDIFLPEVMTHLSDAKLFTQVPGILKSKHLKKKEQIQALELENAMLQNQIRQVTAARDRLADKMSIMIGEELKGPTEFHKFQLMPGDCHPAQGTVVYAIHSDLGNVIAWHTGGSWFSRHPLGSGPARQVSEEHIKWYRKIS